MKHFYFTLFFLGLSFLSSAQEMGGIPVEGLLPIKKIDNSEGTSISKTSDLGSASNRILTTSAITPTGTSSEVGITEGQLSVSLSGSANYNIPILVPPGINGVVPQVSLAYSSQGGPGLAGYGWNIAGISKISRIPATKFHDGIIDGVDLDNLDRFALDGQRLVIKIGTYGASGAVYETENFSNIKVTSYGVHPGAASYGPAYFIVEYPDGSKAYYGNSTDSRTILEYSITYWENPQGVRISYSYNNSNNSLSISSVSYGAIGTATPINKIKFNYTAAYRPPNGYVGGQSIIQLMILTGVVVTSNNIGFRSYLLTHNTNSLNYQRLVTITEKSGDGLKSYNPTVFTYNDTSDSISYANLTTNLSVGNITSLNAGTVSGDFAGNEKMEFLIYPTTGTDSKNKYWLFMDLGAGSYTNIGYQHNVGVFQEIFPTTWLSWNNHLMPKQGWTVAKSTASNYTFTVYSNSASNPILYQYERVVNFPTIEIPDTTCDSNCQAEGVITTIFPKKIISGDFNGDGLTDVIAIDRTLDYNYCDWDNYDQYCTTRTSSTSSKKVYFIDLKRDNTSNFLTYSGELSAFLSSASRIEVADVDGDGKSDFMIFENGKVTTYTLNNTNQLVLLSNFPDTNISIASTKTILLGDYNGDGKTDFIIPSGYGSTTWYKYLSTGNTFIKIVQTYAGISYSQNNSTNTYSYIGCDYDKDGKSDLIQTKSTRNSGNTLGSLNITCYKNKLDAFDSSIAVSSVSPYQSDINLNALPIFLPTGRGIQSKDKPYNPTLEIAFISNNKIHYFNSEKDNVQDQLLRSIRTGYGVTESITYKSLNSSYDENFNVVYTSSYSENYPNSNIESASSFQVVSMIEKQSVTDYKKQLYSYYDAISNTAGLGFLGFKSTSQTNWHNDTNPIITNVSKFDTSLRGAKIESYTVLGQYSANNSPVPSNYIEKNNIIYDSQGFSNKVLKIQRVAVLKYNSLESINSEVSSTYDSYNNPTQNILKVKEGNTVVQTNTENFEYDNQPTAANYYIGRLTKKTQTVIVDGDTSTSEELYSYTNNLLTQVKKKGTGTDYLIEDNIYDAYGNITQKSISATGVVPKVTKYAYDASGRFLIKNTDVENLFTIYDFNLNTGTLNFTTNPYGLKTTYNYDSWFKKIKITDYLGKSNNYSYTINSNKTIVSTNGDDGSANEEIYDDLGRKIKTGIKNINGQFSYISFNYDIYDRKIQSSEPYFGSSPQNWNIVEYDNYGRISVSKLFTGKNINYSYSGLTTVINENNKTKTITKNAIGNVTSLTETPGGSISYTYFANGNLKSSSFEGAITTIEQDGWGRKTKLIDPSAGIFSYEYNVFGENTKEINPNGSTTYTLSPEGRISQKTVVGTNINAKTTYVYDGTSKVLLTSTFENLSESTITTNSYTYDSSKRISQIVETTPYASYTKNYTYDEFGRVSTENNSVVIASKSSAKTIKNTYKNGSPWQILDYPTNAVLWQINNVNAKGELTETLNGALTKSSVYDAYGFPSQIKYDKTVSPTNDVLTLNTVFNNLTGNLMSRSNSMFSWNESFKYDNLDRLTEYTNVVGVQETQSYDNKGRITQNNLGTYNYANTTKPYQNTSISVSVSALTYYTGRPTLNVLYNSFKSPFEIEEIGVDKINFTYSDNNNRSTIFYGGLQSDKLLRPLRKHYSSDGKTEIKENRTTGIVEIISYIGGDSYSASTVLKSDGTNQNYLFLQRDYQNTIVAISDASGTIVEKRLFDAWGNIAKVQNGSGTNLTELVLLDRGYTGHEHLASVNIINMNGRLYDPKIHRFLQPDNNIQAPLNVQNYNRYSYVLNNPLKYTDESGEFLNSLIAGIIDGVSNIINHGINFKSYTWTRTDNAWKIDMGLFKGNIGQIASRFTFEGIQTGIGYVANSFHNYFGGVKSVSYYNEATVVETYSQNWGAFTLSTFIMGQRGITNNPNDMLFQHEYGHILQSRSSGFMYLPKYALPSLFSTGKHSLYWTETDANARALQYFMINDSNFKIENWAFGENDNPIPGYDSKKSFFDDDNQKALNSNITKLSSFEDFLNKVFGSFSSEMAPSGGSDDKL